MLVALPPQDLLTASFRLAATKPVWAVWTEDRGTTQSPPPCPLWDWRQPGSCQSSIWWPSNCQGNLWKYFFYFKFGPLFNQTLQIIPKYMLSIFYILLFLLLHLVLLQPAVFIRKRSCIQTNLHFFSYHSTVDTNINLLEMSFGIIFATVSKSNR